MRCAPPTSPSVPARLKLVGEVAAGHPFDGTVGAGEAARIFTGGVIPPGADTIVIQENTAREGDIVVVTRRLPARASTSASPGSTSRAAPCCSPRAAASATAISRSPPP